MDKDYINLLIKKKKEQQKKYKEPTDNVNIPSIEEIRKMFDEAGVNLSDEIIKSRNYQEDASLRK